MLTLVYQPFAFVTMIVLAYYEARINTRRRILFGYVVFSLCTLALLLVIFSLSVLVLVLASFIVSHNGLLKLHSLLSLHDHQVDVGTSGRGGIPNYVGICVLVAGFGVADAFTQGGIVGDLSFMDPTFMQVKIITSFNCFPS